MTIQSIVQTTQALAGPGAGSLERAFNIAWRATRWLESAVEVARRKRLSELGTAGGPGRNAPAEYVIAAECLKLAAPRPVIGEAATVAAIENAAEVARSVANVFHKQRIARAPKASSDVINDPRRLAKLRRGRTIREKAAAAFADENRD
jgi:hypothetical protein